MKALILAAGFGTRLGPYTDRVPKPLFTLMSKPVLGHIIEKLLNAGCDDILVNTHHLHSQIHEFIKTQQYPVRILYEPVILETGGAIANARPFLEDDDFFVINSDIFFTLDLACLHEFHKIHRPLATLAVHDYPPFNKIGIDACGYITDFESEPDGLAFTGIQILSPEIYNFFPDKKIFSSIEVYKKICRKNHVAAFRADNIYWSDIGTQDSYSRTSIYLMAAKHFRTGFSAPEQINISELAGDGSDRRWFRVHTNAGSAVVSDHGICLAGTQARAQLDAFIHIGNHLYSKNIPVPRIFDHDAMSGTVIMQDLGDTLLETLVRKKNNPDFTAGIYKKVIRCLIEFSRTGIMGFKPEWTYQTRSYSRQLILEKECRYFMQEFVNNYLGVDAEFDTLAPQFCHIADHALVHGLTGLMHRDFQSKNIMIFRGTIFFVDFQSARPGPLQYDLASLLIDPYVQLDTGLKSQLLQYAMDCLELSPIQKKEFAHSFMYCCLARNLQCLGAFSFLTLKKGKKQFEQYIPAAFTTLIHVLTEISDKKIEKFSEFVHRLDKEALKWKK
jgi:aminoglycoside/choline kinase family phosphotransferase/choline kinase